MGIYTIDNYYGVEFYNETLQALKNNNVPFKEYISSKAPYHFFIETDASPAFINYDEVSKSYEKFLINLVEPLKPNDAMKLLRRDSFVNIGAINEYAINDALKLGQNNNQGIFFHSTKEEVSRISKEYPRKIYYFGKYLNNTYSVFFTDNLIIKNYFSNSNVLIESSKFSNITKLEIKLNYNIFTLRDRLRKFSETPYFKDGKYYPISVSSPELSKLFTL